MTDPRSFNENGDIERPDPADFPDGDELDSREFDDEKEWSEADVKEGEH